MGQTLGLFLRVDDHSMGIQWTFNALDKVFVSAVSLWCKPLAWACSSGLMIKVWASNELPTRLIRCLYLLFLYGANLACGLGWWSQRGRAEKCTVCIRHSVHAWHGWLSAHHMIWSKLCRIYSWSPSFFYSYYWPVTSARQPLLQMKLLVSQDGTSHYLPSSTAATSKSKGRANECTTGSRENLHLTQHSWCIHVILFNTL